MGVIIYQGGQYSPVNIVLGGHYLLVNNVQGGQYSLVNNVWGDNFGGDNIHYYTGLVGIDWREPVSMSYDLGMSELVKTWPSN